MKTKTVDFEVLIPNLAGTEIAERVKVPVKVEWDEEVKDWLMTAEAHELIENTKARLIGLLTPAQMKELRERYDYSQKEMGELFQVGEKSWSRWESGKHRPSRSINLLIRALYEGEISINYLLKRAGKPVREVEAAKSWEVVRHCWYAPTSPTQKFGAILKKVRITQAPQLAELSGPLQKWITLIRQDSCPTGAIYLVDRNTRFAPRVDEPRKKMELQDAA